MRGLIAVVLVLLIAGGSYWLGARDAPRRSPPAPVQQTPPPVAAGEAVPAIPVTQ